MNPDAKNVFDHKTAAVLTALGYPRFVIAFPLLFKDDLEIRVAH